MSTPLLNIHLREETGKNKAIQARKQGRVPGILYSRGEKTKSIFFDNKEMEKILARHGNSMKMALSLEGDKTYAVIKEIQRGNLKNELLHIDFQTLDENEKVKMLMPIHVVNREKVESSVQIIQVNINEVEIQTYPKYLPERVELDALRLKEKEMLTLEDLNIANDSHIEILDEKDRVVASLVYASRGEESKEGEEE